MRRVLSPCVRAFALNCPPLLNGDQQIHARMDWAGDDIDAFLIELYILCLARLNGEPLSGERLWTLGAHVAGPILAEAEEVRHAALLIREVDALSNSDLRLG